ncbi:phage tail protein [Corynebacterium sp. TAE3-ERU12]|uniref:Gp37-like protein n=1 Tax=Corynebacterium sp. TAE3-ERU12 TaxID=2849491 RepID=UPI001C4856F8|nr:phage tail protein [Corynebacterium sp. TAE3-ERU12]MBV7294934.1 phage tail protein [Corynebacterium sp. TAE3-ERU12]
MTQNDQALNDAHDDVWVRCQKQLSTMDQLRQQPSKMRLWDGDFEQSFWLQERIESDLPFVMNEASTGTVTLRADSHAAQWVLDRHHRLQNVFLTADVRGMRWSGQLDSYELEKTDKGERLLTLNFEHDLGQIMNLPCWPNPFAPATGPQFPHYFTLAGPSRYMLKLLLFVNLFRLSGNLWTLPDNPLDPRTWAQGLVPSEWPVVVQPDSLVLDDSQWCIVDTRMDTWFAAAEEILADAGLMVTCRRWLDGDPPPWPGAIMRTGQLVVDIIDKSGVFEQTSHGGTIFGGLARTITSHADNLVDEIVNTVADPIEPAEYSVSQWLGTSPTQPWVIYRDGYPSGVQAAKYTRVQEGPVQITAGGHSAPGVNEAQSLAIRLAGNVMGSIFRLDTLGDIIDDAVAPMYEDVWLAFATHKSLLRIARQGHFHKQEAFADDVDNVFTLSGVIAFRRAFWRTRGHDNFELKVADGAPYLIGAPGQGHFELGDRIGATIKGLPPGRVLVEQVHQLVLHESRDGVEWDIKCGDPRATESPWDRGLRHIRRLTRSMRRHNLA